MPSLSQLPNDISRERFIRALAKLGFEISKKGGNGSHYKATWPKTQKSVTIQCDLRKDVLYYLLKDIKKYSGVNWEDIKGVL
jgi:predicted RNA binding protein YcfA (HicA-like mRNA interferase family)